MPVAIDAVEPRRRRPLVDRHRAQPEPTARVAEDVVGTVGGLAGLGVEAVHVAREDVDPEQVGGDRIPTGALAEGVVGLDSDLDGPAHESSSLCRAARAWTWAEVAG